MIDPVDEGLVQGYLHRAPGERAIVLAHGAGSDANSRLLVALAEEFASNNWSVLRLNLPFRQRGGAPLPATANIDREGIRDAATFLRRAGYTQIYAGGHSYGGRQASMLCAGQSEVATALLLLSYPLHPPRRPQQLRTAHFPQLTTPALFVHGERDPFGSPEEMQSALAQLPASRLLMVKKAAHELKPIISTPSTVVEAFQLFTAA